MRVLFPQKIDGQGGSDRRTASVHQLVTEGGASRPRSLKPAQPPDRKRSVGSVGRTALLRSDMPDAEGKHYRHHDALPDSDKIPPAARWTGEAVFARIRLEPMTVIEASSTSRSMLRRSCLSTILPVIGRTAIMARAVAVKTIQESATPLCAA